MMNPEYVESFFVLPRERNRIQRLKESGAPRPWTADPILDTYRFCCVRREDDRVTVWFRENLRGLLRDRAEVLFVTVMFRWFNKIETAERLMKAQGAGPAAFIDFHPPFIREVLTGVSPIVTAAYIVKSPNGRSKLEGIIWCLEQIHPHCMEGARRMRDERWTLQRAAEWLQDFPFLGPFMAYEIVTDLRHTALLENASDIMTWANAGPGAQRGLNRLSDRPLDKGLPAPVTCEEMRQLLALAPAQGFPEWELREVEHTLCEWDKYERTRLGQGTPKQRYRPHQG